MSIAVRSPCDEAAIRHGMAAAPCEPSAGGWVLAAAILGSGMAFIDGTVVNVALPAIQRELRATLYEAQWVVESYALFLAALLLLGGSFGDRFGRRRMFAIGVAIFGAASVACALSRDVHQLIAARAVQGVGAALLVNLLTLLLYAALGGGLFFLPLDLIHRSSARAAHGDRVGRHADAGSPLIHVAVAHTEKGA